MSTDSDKVVDTNELLVDVPEDITTQTVLHSKWTFYYLSRKNAGGNIRKDYQEAIEPVGTFQTAEHFWRIYDHLLKPNDVKGGAVDYHLFKNDIKPAWEDPANQDGGKWLLKLRKGLASRCWEELVLAVIGEQFDVGHEICGIVVSMRGHEDRISIWNKTADNAEAIAKIEYTLKKILNLPNFVTLDYQRHHDRVEASGNAAGGKTTSNSASDSQNKSHSHSNSSWGNKVDNRSHKYKDNEQDGEKHHRYNNRDRESTNRNDGHGQDGHRKTWNKKEESQSGQSWGRNSGENSSPRPPPPGGSNSSWGKSTNKATTGDSTWVSTSNTSGSGSGSSSWGKKKTDSSGSSGNWSRSSN